MSQPSMSVSWSLCRAGTVAMTCWLALSSCTELFGVAVPREATLLSELPAQYSGWWSLVEECSEQRARLSDVTWWVLPRDADPEAPARYYSRDHAIVLPEGEEVHGDLVRHEMLHAILAGRRVSGHPKGFFEARCGGVVSCNGSCLDEVGGPPGVDGIAAARVADMSVGVRAEPSTVSLSSGTMGCTTIVVTARNESAAPRVLDLGEQTAFEWVIEGHVGGSGGSPSPPNDIVVLPPGAARRYVADCPRPIREFTVGDYLLSGEWKGKRSTAITLTIEP